MPTGPFLRYTKKITPPLYKKSSNSSKTSENIRSNLFLESVPVNMQIVLDTVDGTFEHETPHQEDGEHHVWHGGRHPDHLAGRFYPFEQ